MITLLRNRLEQCKICKRWWNVSRKSEYPNGYSCPDCEPQMKHLKTACAMEQVVQTAYGPGYIQKIKPDGNLEISLIDRVVNAGRPITIWPLDVKPIGSRHDA